MYNSIPMDGSYTISDIEVDVREQHDGVFGSELYWLARSQFGFEINNIPSCLSNLTRTNCRIFYSPQERVTP
jgi:hypothetical protein